MENVPDMALDKEMFILRTMVHELESLGYAVEEKDNPRAQLKAFLKRHERESGIVYAVKYYPAGATTNSAAGVTSLERCTGALEAMQREHAALKDRMS